MSQESIPKAISVSNHYAHYVNETPWRFVLVETIVTYDDGSTKVVKHADTKDLK